MDVLSGVLNGLRVEGTLSRRSEYSAPWGVDFAPVDHASFLLVEAGSCVLSVEGMPTTALMAGDLVMFRPGHRAALADHADTPKVPYSEVLAAHAPPMADKYARDYEAYPTLRYGGGGPVTALRGFGLRLEGFEPRPLLALLPPFIHITYERRAALPWLESTIRFLMHEAHQKLDGSDLVSVRLVDLLFVQVLRAWFQEQPPGEAGWLGALRDPSIGHALRIIHRYPAEPWTLEGLARTVGMSRSSFSARFQSLVGTPPMKYLTELRMNRAATLLKRDPTASMARVAAQVGYDSESSFGRAFKRYFHASPGAFRKNEARSG